MNEPDLIAKLITESHLSVEEREALPFDKVRFSTIVDQASKVLLSDSWLPPGRANASEFDGGSLERLSEGYALHVCHEIGVMRYGSVETRHFDDISEAVRAWLLVEHGDSIDGIEIAWSE